MTVLYPKLSLDPEETLLSYIDRLSLMHTGRGMERLLADRGIHREHFTSGRVDAVAMLAAATGHDVEEMQRSVIRVFPRGALFRGEEMSKTFLSPRTARYCPACLSEDGPKVERRHRILWGFRHVHRCDRHGAWLSKAPVKNATNIRAALGTSPIAKAEDADGHAPEYLGWLQERMHGESSFGDPWLDGQTTEQVLAASEMLGGVLEHGHRVKLTKMTAAETEEATDIGFSIYREGAEAIEEALNTIRQTSSASAVQAGPLAYYGTLFDWLDRRANAIDPGPIRDILRDHIVKHSAVEPGTKVLGVEIVERRFHTIASLSAEVRIDRPRLCRLLKKLGEIPLDATDIESGNMIFEAANTVPLIRDFNTAVPLEELPEYLGASKRQVEILYREGIVKPLVPRTGRGSVRHVVFSRRHLDDLLEILHALPEVDEELSGKYHALAYACQRGVGHFEKVFSAILVGRIPAHRQPGKSGIAAICIDVNSALLMKI